MAIIAGESRKICTECNRCNDAKHCPSPCQHLPPAEQQHKPNLIEVVVWAVVASSAMWILLAILLSAK